MFHVFENTTDMNYSKIIVMWENYHVEDSWIFQRNYGKDNYKCAIIFNCQYVDFFNVPMHVVK